MVLVVALAVVAAAAVVAVRVAGVGGAFGAAVAIGLAHTSAISAAVRS